jgi:hypothetical protein
MSDENSNNRNTWKLPDGIENYIEEGIIKTAAGAVGGAILGSIFFRSGKGWRMACSALGAGAGVGSTLERAGAFRQK